MAERTDETIIKISADNTSVQAAVRAIGAVRKAQQGVTAGARQDAAAIRDYANAIQDAKKQAELLGDTSSRLSSVAGLAGGLGAGQLGSTIQAGSDIFDTLEAVKVFKAELPALGKQLLESGALTSRFSQAIQGIESPTGKAAANLGLVGGSLLAGGAAAVALSVAFNEANKIIEQTAALTRGALTASEEYYTALYTLTTEGVQDRIQELETQRQIDRARLDEAKRFKEAADAAIDNGGAFVNVLGNAAIALGANLGGIQDLDALIKDLEGSVSSADQSIGRLNTGVANNAFVAQDATAAEEELKQARVEAMKATEEAARQALRDAQATLDAGVNAELRARLAADGLTEQQAQERIAAAKREQEIISGILEAGGGSAENAKRLKEQLADLGVEITALSGELPKLRIRDGINNAIKSAQEIIKVRETLNTELDKITASLGDKITDLTRARDSAISDAQREASKGQAEAVKEREDALKELVVEAGEERVKIADTFYKSERASLKAFNRSYSDAVGSRDVLAAVQAEQRRKDEQDANRESRDESLSALNSNLSKQKASIEASYANQVATVNARLTEQTMIADMRYREQVQATQQAAERERQIAQAKAQQEISIAQGGANGVLSIAGSFWSGMLAQARSALSSLSAPQKSGGLLGMVGNLLGFADGGRPPLNTPVMVNDRGRGMESARFDNGDLAVFSRPAQIFSANQTQRMLGAGGGGGGVNIPININGLSRADVRQQVIDQLDTALDQAEWGN